MNYGFARRASVFLLAILIMLCSFAFPKASAAVAPSEQNVVANGKSGYVHLSKYAQPTDQEGIYKIALTVEGFVEIVPIYVVFVLDMSPSMYHVALADAPNPYLTSRWEGLTVGFNAAMDVFTDEVQNPSYDKTYVSVVTFSGANNTKIRTADTTTGSYYGRTGPSTVDTSPLPAFPSSELYHTTPFTAYRYLRTQMFTANGGFAKVKDSEDTIRKSMPNYPYVDSTMQQAFRALGTTFPIDSGLTSVAYQQGWFPFDGNGTGGAFGLQLAYRMLDSTWTVGNDPDLKTADDVARAKRYIIYLGDGADSWHPARTQYWGAALKAPRSVAFPAAGGSGMGQNAKIWTIGFGLDEITNAAYRASDSSAYAIPDEVSTAWGSSFPGWNSSAITGGTPVSGSMPWPNTVIEPHLVSLASEITNPADYASYPHAAIPAGDLTVTPALAYTELDQAFKYYQPRVKLSGGDMSAYTTYRYVRKAYPDASGAVDAAETVFADFAKAITAPGDIIVKDVIGTQYEIVKMPGEDLLTTNGEAGSDFDVRGDTITWNLDKIPVTGKAATLTYYVKFKAAGTDPNLYYPTNEYASISYKRYGLAELGEDTALILDVLKLFPQPLVRPSDNSIQNNTVHLNPTDDGGGSVLHTGNENTTSIGIDDGTIGGIGIPAGVQPFGTPMPTYTPSVTPTPRATVQIIEDDEVQDATEEMPLTGEKSLLFLAVLLVLAGGGIGFSVYKKRRSS